MSFAIQLIKARNARAWSAPELSRRAGVRHSLIYDFEADKRLPNLKTLLRLADALGVTLDWLCGRTTD